MAARSISIFIPEMSMHLMLHFTWDWSFHLESIAIIAMVYSEVFQSCLFSDINVITYMSDVVPMQWQWY